MAVIPYKDLPEGKKQQVTWMFDHISGRYDFLNHLLSLNFDKYWRKKAIQKIEPFEPGKILDIATGTGDFAVCALKLNPTKIIGVDLSEQMLSVARKKCSEMESTDKMEFIRADAENLPFGDESFKAVISGFGVRNFENLEKGLSESYRVLSKGGHLVILEFSLPQNPLINWIYNGYFTFILPLIGRFISRDDSAYRYLPESVTDFPVAKVFLEILTRQGFIQCTATPLSSGIVTVYTGIKP